LIVPVNIKGRKKNPFEEQKYCTTRKYFRTRRKDVCLN
jgi:hypothetical protein